MIQTSDELSERGSLVISGWMYHDKHYLDQSGSFSNRSYDNTRLPLSENPYAKHKFVNGQHR